MNGDLSWVFFDLGWTLVDETEAHRARLRRVSSMLADYGHPASIAELVGLCEDAATRFSPSPFRGMFEGLGLRDAQRNLILASVPYQHEHETLYPGVLDLLAALHSELQLGVIANQSEGAERRLRSWSVQEHFSLVFSSTEYGLSKPDPGIFRCTLREAGCRPEEALMVGDRLDNDIGPAKRQGWNTVRVLQGFSRFQEPRGPHEEPDWTIEAIRELKYILLGARG